MVQALIKIKDIDDHPPVFLQENMTTGTFQRLKTLLDVCISLNIILNETQMMTGF